MPWKCIGPDIVGTDVVSALQETCIKVFRYFWDVVHVQKSEKRSTL